MEIRNVIFDLGGVVVDWNPEKVMREYPGDPELVTGLFKRGFFNSYWPDYDRGVKTQSDLAHEMALFADRTYAECWDLLEFIKHSLSDLSPTVSLIRELSARGYGLYCLSNMSFEFYDYMKDREVFHYLDGRIISALEKVIKPERRIYELLTERFGLVPSESVFVDDLKANVEAASALGFHTVHFADKEKGMQELRSMLGL